MHHLRYQRIKVRSDCGSSEYPSVDASLFIRLSPNLVTTHDTICGGNNARNLGNTIACVRHRDVDQVMQCTIVTHKGQGKDKQQFNTFLHL